MKKKPIGTMFQEWIKDEYEKSRLPQDGFSNKYKTVNIRQLSRIIHNQDMVFLTSTIDRIMAEFNTDLATNIEKYGEYKKDPLKESK